MSEKVIEPEYTGQIIEQKNLKFFSKPENINLVEALITEICKEFNIPGNLYGNILIAVTEAVNNAIQHGNKNNPSKYVNIQVEHKNNKLIFTISDEGNGFDFHNIPDPRTPENLSKITGRGIFIMKNLSDELYFKEPGNKVKIVFYL